MLSRIGKFYICFSPQIFLLLSSNRTQAEEFKQKKCDSVQSNNFHFKKASQLQHYSRREDDTGVEEMAKLHEGPVRNRHTHGQNLGLLQLFHYAQDWGAMEVV